MARPRNGVGTGGDGHFHGRIDSAKNGGEICRAEILQRHDRGALSQSGWHGGSERGMQNLVPAPVVASDRWAVAPRGRCTDETGSALVQWAIGAVVVERERGCASKQDPVSRLKDVWHICLSHSDFARVGLRRATALE